MLRIVVLVFLLCVCVLVPAGADDLFIGNRPFKGEVSGAGSQMYGEVEALAKALGLEVKRQGGVTFLLRSGESTTEPPTGAVVVVAGVVVAHTHNGSQLFVKLGPLAEALGGKLVINSQLGTVDLYKPSGKPRVGGSTAKRSGGALKATATFPPAYKRVPLKGPDNLLAAVAENPKRAIYVDRYEDFDGLKLEKVIKLAEEATADSGGEVVNTKMQPLGNGTPAGQIISKSGPRLVCEIFFFERGKCVSLSMQTGFDPQAFQKAYTEQLAVLETLKF